MQLFVHCPFWQTPLHGAPHPPQFWGSVFVSTHTPPHMVVPPWQTHVDDRQSALSGHGLLQAPQCDSSDVLSTHTPLHFSAGRQSHTPAWHTPIAQVAPSSTDWSQSLSMPSQISGAPGY